MSRKSVFAIILSAVLFLFDLNAAGSDEIYTIKSRGIEPFLTIHSTAFRSCAQWHDLFGSHFDSLLDYFLILQELTSALYNLNRQSQAGDLAKTLNPLMQKLESTLAKVRSTTPDGFFSGFDSTISWALPIESYVSPPEFPFIMDKLRQLSGTDSDDGSLNLTLNWDKIAMAGGLLSTFFDEGMILVGTPLGSLGPKVPTERNVSIQYTGKELFLKMSLRPMERCLVEPSFGGQLGASGRDNKLSPTHLWLDIEKWIIGEKRVSPTPIYFRMLFPERLRFELVH